jgi:hypothetical protein
MYALDVIAAFALASGAFLGAGRGLWRILAGGFAVTLGALAATAASGVLAAALNDLGVAYPGDIALGFFLPFALVSVYARYIAGLWLSKRLLRAPGRDRWLGAAAGAVWTVFALSLLVNVVWPGQAEADQKSAPEIAAPSRRRPPPFCSWLARYPGRVASRLRPEGLVSRERKRTWEKALKTALDAERVQARSAAADREAASLMREMVRRKEQEPSERRLPLKPVRLRTP